MCKISVWPRTLLFGGQHRLKGQFQLGSGMSCFDMDVFVQISGCGISFCNEAMLVGTIERKLAERVQLGNQADEMARQPVWIMA